MNTRGLLTLFLVSALTLGGSPVARAAEAAEEYDVKAAFLYNFARFVAWPNTAGEDPFRICVLGEDPFQGALERVVGGKTVHDRPLEILRMRSENEADRCSIVFIANSEHRRLDAVLDRVSREGLLTVGDQEGFAERGGMINLPVRDNRVRLEINVDATRDAGLKVSSQLLRLARVVSRAEGE